MAARNPSDFTRWNDVRKFIGTEPILASALDTVLDDLEYILDARSIALCDAYSPAGTNSGSFVELRRWTFIAQDMCDVSGVANNELEYEYYVRTWLTGSATEGEVKIESVNATSTVSATQTVTSTTPWWTPLDYLSVSTNDIEETIKLSGQVTAGTGSILTAGILLVSPQT